MRIETRKVLDKSFSALGVISIGLMIAFLVLILGPIVWKGSQAFIFSGTIEHRKLMFDHWDRGDKTQLNAELDVVEKVRKPVFEIFEAYELEVKGMPRKERGKRKKELKALKKLVEELVGPFPGERQPVLFRQRYGQTRWDRVQVKLDKILLKESWDYSDPDKGGIKVFKPRSEGFERTRMAELFPYIESNVEQMMRPKWTFYYQFITDSSLDSHIFGGIWPEFLGTLYLSIGAMIFAVPMGIFAAIYFCEYAKQGVVISFLRICISTLAGVPSIVFGLFGLAFFINTIQVSDSKSVLAGSLTLSLLVLPTIIRASEEAIQAVPSSYKEAALALGAGRWWTIVTIILPAALPGILTGIVICLGRAAGETAPIIFTAAVSVGKALKLDEVFTQPTPALPWNIYNLCTEHEAVDEIRHVQFGMVLALIMLVLVLNVGAIIIRAKVSKNLKV